MITVIVYRLNCKADDTPYVEHTFDDMESAEKFAADTEASDPTVICGIEE